VSLSSDASGRLSSCPPDHQRTSLPVQRWPADVPAARWTSVAPPRDHFLSDQREVSTPGCYGLGTTSLDHNQWTPHALQQASGLPVLPSTRASRDNLAFRSSRLALRLVHTRSRFATRVRSTGHSRFKRAQPAFLHTRPTSCTRVRSTGHSRFNRAQPAFLYTRFLDSRHAFLVEPDV
jgi:hypothetical protein